MGMNQHLSATHHLKEEHGRLLEATLLNLSLMEIGRKKHEAAIVYLDRVLKINQLNTKAIGRKGSCLEAVGLLDESLQHYLKAGMTQEATAVRLKIQARNDNMSKRLFSSGLY